MTTTTAHAHRASTAERYQGIETPFAGCANADRCRPAAHGGYAVLEFCRTPQCRYARITNRNAGTAEYGRWHRR